MDKLERTKSETTSVYVFISDDDFEKAHMVMDTKLKAWKYLYGVNSDAGTDPDRIALTDGVKSYTYNQMFEAWKKYAAVFSALQMTSANKARVGLMGATTPEVILSFYALNMVGAEISVLSSFNAINTSKIIHDIREEHLTDLILTDEILMEKSIRELLGKRGDLGLRNIIVIHTSVGGSTVPMPVCASCEAKANGLRQSFPMLYMDTLLFYYGNTPIYYAASETGSSFILHTSGTTGGSGKPVPLTDLSFNSVCENLQALKSYDEIKKDLVSPVIVDLSNVFGMVVQVHAMLSLGGTVVTVPGNSLNPLMYRAIPAHKITVMFCLGAVIELWSRVNDPHAMDFSSIRMVIMGGSYISASDKQRYCDFFRSHGAKDFVMLNGYGTSEVGGVCTLTGPDIQDESIGRALPGYELRFFDEDTERFLSAADAPCTGVLHIHSQGMTTGMLDGKQIIAMEDIDGRPYLCTNDLVRIDEAGKLTFLGRSNRYFLNSNGEKYQSGRVETEVSRQPGIESCGIVPVYEKVGHDNLPMLCVKAAEGCPRPLEAVHQALLTIFKTEKTLSTFHLPRYVLLAESLPHNANGKIDLHQINQGKVVGQKYSVDAIIAGGNLQSLSFTPLKKDEDNMIEAVYKGMAQELVSGVVRRPDYGLDPTRNQIRACQAQCQMYLSLMMQQNMMAMSWINSTMTQVLNLFAHFQMNNAHDNDSKGGNH